MIKAPLTLTAVLASALIVASIALGAGTSYGSSFITDTLGGNGSPKATPDTFDRAEAIHNAQGQRFITDTLGGNGSAKATPATFKRAGAIHNAQGLRFTTDTLGGNGGVPASADVAFAGRSFSWADAGVGAAGTAGALLALLGAALVVSRRHMRLGV